MSTEQRILVRRQRLLKPGYYRNIVRQEPTMVPGPQIIAIKMPFYFTRMEAQATIW